MIFEDYSSSIPTTDIDEARIDKEDVKHHLEMIGNFLKNADDLCTSFEQGDQAAIAIQRKLIDLADVVGEVARDLPSTDDQDDREDIKLLARAVIDDAQEVNQKVVRFEMDEGAYSVAHLAESDVIDAMSDVRSVLIDIEDSLRSISRDEAEEIADVTLMVLKVFIWSLQSIHDQITPELITDGTTTSMDIEIIEGEVDDKESTSTNSRKEKMRLIWPPIGPSVLSAICWSKDSILKKPILSAAIAMTLWPVTLICTFIGAPIVAGGVALDFALQTAYDTIQDTPIIESLEKGKSNLFQIGKLYFLVSKLLVKQSIRVGKRQIDRRGGLGNIAQDACGWTIDRALHPLETAGQCFNGFIWGASFVVNNVKRIRNEHVLRDDIPVHMV